MTDRRVSRRNFLLPILAVSVVAAILHFRPRANRDAGIKNAEDGTPTPQAESATENRPFAFLRNVDLPVPPEPVLRRGPIEDRVERLVDRTLWAPLDLRNRALNELARLKKPHEIQQFVALADQEWRRDPLRGYVFLPTLAQVHDPRGAQIVEEAATHSSNMIRVEAARALGTVDDADAVARLETLLSDHYEGVRTGAIRSLIDMKTPSALDVLERYAQGDPDERIKHVLYRIGADTENPDGIPVLRKYLDSPGTARIVALQMLAKFGDPSALDILYEMVEHGDANARHTGLIDLLEAPHDLIDPKRVLDRLEDVSGENRRAAAELYLRMAQAKALTGEEADTVARALEKHLTDLDYRARIASLAALHALGRKDLVEPFEKAILTASGPGLHDALQITTVWCKDEKALPLVLQRIKADGKSAPIENRARLITALGDINDGASIDAYLDVIREARANEPRDESGIELSKRAALHVSTLGPSIQGKLMEIARDGSATLEARLRALDGLRGINGVDCVQELLDLAADGNAPHEVRLAAVETLPFLVGVDMFDAVLDSLDRLVDRELRLKALYVLLDYA